MVYWHTMAIKNLPKLPKIMGNGKSTRKKLQLKFKFNLKNLLLLSLALLFIGPFLLSFSSYRSGQENIPLSQVLADIKENKVEKVGISEERLTVKYKDGGEKTSIKESGESFSTILKNSGIDPSVTSFAIEDKLLSRVWLDILGILLPVGLMALFFLFIFRQARGAQDSVFSFGKSGAKVFAKGKQNVTFKDVAGVDEAKRELEEVVDFLKNPGKYKALGARTPKGVLLVGPAGTGKCVTGDTTIWTNKGLMEIREIPRYYYVDEQTSMVYGANLASFDIDKTTSKDKFASHWFDLGEQNTIKISLARGFTVEGTQEHPVVVMTSDGLLRFRKLEEIREGDYVGLQYGREMFGRLQMVDTKTAYLMGLLTGDGNLSHASRIGITSVDPEIIKFFREYVTLRYPKSAITHREQSYLVSNWDFKRYLYQLGMSYLLSFDKVIPPTILQAPKEVQISFLQGLFDTDASIESKRAAFEYTTVSERMAHQVQMMLLNLGLVCGLNVKGKRENGYFRDVYRITLTGSSLVKFNSIVGFRLSRKQKILKRHIIKMGRVNTNIDVIPGVGRLIEDSWRELSQRKLSNGKLSKTIDKVRRRDRISKQTLEEYVSYANDLRVDVKNLEYLRSLLEAKLFFSPVVEKTKSFARVYDFTVPETHSFLGNGFVNHNTLLSRAVAGEAAVPFFSMAGSEFMEMLVGVGASRVRDLFSTAKKAAPSIIFIDEIDAIGRQRGHGLAGGHDEREQTLNQILVEMDGFTPNDNVIVLAATNRRDLLDSALVRPGRFDREVTLDMPDREGRLAILKIHSKGKKFARGISWERIASRTVGFSGADLENMLNEAAIFAARENAKEISFLHTEEAATKVKLGPAKHRLQTKEDREITAYHEAGHAMVAHVLPHVDPVHSISIVARSKSLGHTYIPSEMDRIHETKTRLLQMITVMMGGRAAETLVFNEMTAGAASDIQKATDVARSMVLELGMSKLGPVNWSPQIDERMRFMEPINVSPSMQDKIDREVSEIVETCHKQAIKILKSLRSKLKEVAEALIKNETLDRDEFEKIVGEKIRLNREAKAALAVVGA